MSIALMCRRFQHEAQADGDDYAYGYWRGIEDALTKTQDAVATAVVSAAGPGWRIVDGDVRYSAAWLDGDAA